MYSLKKAIFNLVNDNGKRSLINIIFEIFIIFLIIINVIIIILETFENLIGNFKYLFSYIETITVIIFTIEYVARLWTSDYIFPNKKPAIARLKYAFSFMAIVDIISIIPFYLINILQIHNLLFLRILRLLRFFRILKLNRYTDALINIRDVLKKKSYQLICSLLIVILLMILSSVFMYYIEHEKQPDMFVNAFSGLWWAFLTVTTVGYGDIYPITGLGRLLGALISLLGIGLIAIPTGILSAGFTEQTDNKNSINRIIIIKNNIKKKKRHIKNAKRFAR